MFGIVKKGGYRPPLGPENPTPPSERGIKKSSSTERGRFSLLSRPEMLRHLELGNIVIDPFDPKSVGTNSYDVTLGEYVWRVKPLGVRKSHQMVDRDMGDRLYLYNPYDKTEVENLWYLEQAQRFESAPLRDQMFFSLNGIGPEDKIFFIRPLESILAHTREFIGGCSDNITTKMFARSSAGRNFLHVCACAGLGDIGFFSKWTLEVFNRSTQYTIPLVVGRRYAQIAFFETEPLRDEGYSRKGKYQKYADLEELKATWKPEDMLPRMYRDREVNHG